MQEISKRLINKLPVLIILLWSSYVLLQNFYYQFGFSDDKLYYIPAAKALLNGTSPDKFNFEHPPLGKYLIGLSWILTGNFYTMSRLFGILSILLIYLITKQIYDRKVALFTSAMISFDTLYMYTFTTALLDVYATFFTLLSLYLLMLIINKKEKTLLHILLGLSIGAAISSKWSAIPITIALIAYLYIMEKPSTKYLPLTLVTILLVYVLTYTMFFINNHSLIDFIILQIKMLEYQGGFHHPTLTFFAIVNTKIFLRLQMLIGYSFGTITMNSNTTVINATLQGRVFTFNLTQGSPTWYLFAPTLFLYAWKLSKKFNKKETLPLLLFLSYTPILYSNLIDWYILPALPFLYMIVSKTLSNKTRTIILIINIINFSLVVNNIIHDYQIILPT